MMKMNSQESADYGKIIILIFDAQTIAVKRTGQKDEDKTMMRIRRGYC